MVVKNIAFAAVRPASRLYQKSGRMEKKTASPRQQTRHSAIFPQKSQELSNPRDAYNRYFDDVTLFRPTTRRVALRKGVTDVRL